MINRLDKTKKLKFLYSYKPTLLQDTNMITIRQISTSSFKITLI
jgi:hypothetical protein